MQRCVVELHLPFDARGPNDAKILARLDRVLEQRSLADAGVPMHDEHGAMTIPRGTQEPLEHRALALPAEQSPACAVTTIPAGCHQGQALRVSGIRSAGWQAVTIPLISEKAATDNLPDYAPVPRSALGPGLNEQGYYVGRISETCTG